MNNLKDNVDFFAPVVIFAYNRVDTLKKCLNALATCSGQNQTRVKVYSDAPRFSYHAKDVIEVRRFLAEFKEGSPFLDFDVVERETNFYIEQNIINGVTETLKQNECVIVLEDDGLPHRDFLLFMNAALQKYRKYEEIMHVGAFTFIEPADITFDAFFWPYVENTGGWATWSRAWEKFKYFNDKNDLIASLSQENLNYLKLNGNFNFMDGANINPLPWDICWFASLARENALAVQSTFPMLINIGLYNGVHFTPAGRLMGKSAFETNFREPFNYRLPDQIRVDRKNIEKLEDFYLNLGRGIRKRIWMNFLGICVLLGLTKVAKKLRQIFYKNV